MIQRRHSLVVILAIAVTACGVTDARDRAQRIGEQYFTAAAAGDETAMFALYDDAFYAAMPRDKWTRTYSALRRKLGKPVQHTLQSWMVNVSGSGQNVTLVYNVVYEHAHGTETLLLFLPRGSTPGGIRGHNFNSDALLK
jgi:hypothetical protein